MNKTVAALAIASAAGGCADGRSASTEESGAARIADMVQMSLALPDGVDTLDYSITGGPAEVSRGGSLEPTGDEELTLNVGELPSGRGYMFAVRAMTPDGQSCAGTAAFDIEQGVEAVLDMELTCDSGARYELGSITLRIDVVAVKDMKCPVVSGVSALPLEVFVGSKLALEGFTIPEGLEDLAYRWQGGGNAFSERLALSTGYTCRAPGDHKVRFSILKERCPLNYMEVTVTCTAIER